MIIAAGPLCSEELSDDIKNFVNSEYLSFYDAIAPIVEKESLDFQKLFMQTGIIREKGLISTVL